MVSFASSWHDKFSCNAIFDLSSCHSSIGGIFLGIFSGCNPSLDQLGRCLQPRVDIYQTKALAMDNCLKNFLWRFETHLKPNISKSNYRFKIFQGVVPSSFTRAPPRIGFSPSTVPYKHKLPRTLHFRL